MNESNLNKLTENVITKQDLVYLLDDINQAQELIYQEGENLEQKVSEQLKEILGQQDLSSREQRKKFLSQLKERLQELPQVRITIAFVPSDSFLKEISQWLENEIGDKVIIDLTVNHKIVGGAIIEYQGRYLNLALNKKIKQATSHE